MSKRNPLYSTVRDKPPTYSRSASSTTTSRRALPSRYAVGRPAGPAPITSVVRRGRSRSTLAPTELSSRSSCSCLRPLFAVRNRGDHVIAVHARDRVDADLLRARLLAFAVERAMPEAFLVHLCHHPERATLTLRLALRAKPPPRNF